MNTNRRSAFVLAAAIASLGTAATASANAIVTVAEGADLTAESLRTVRSIATSELRARGVVVIEDESLEGVHAVGAETASLAQRFGAERVFVLRFGPLRKKVLISLEEISPLSGTPLQTARLTASSLDESDIVIPRLVRSVVDKEAVDDGQRIATLTDQETVPVKKKPGEGFFLLGVSLTPQGGSVGWSYEARTWRLGFLFQGAEDDPGFFGVEGAWIPLDTGISPYVGLGIGIVSSAGDEGASAVGTKLEAGAEFFRLHGVRLLAGANAIIPLKSLPQTDTVSFGLFVRVGF